MTTNYDKAERCFISSYNSQTSKHVLLLNMPCGMANVPLAWGEEREIRALQGLLVLYFEKEFNKVQQTTRCKQTRDRKLTIGKGTSEGYRNLVKKLNQ